MTTTEIASTAWLPLLRSLTAESADWGILKNVDRALTGAGDIDSIAPKGDWARLERCHREWANSIGATATIACTHAPDLFTLLAVVPGHDSLLQLDLFSSCYWRGSTLFSAHQVAPLMTMDPRGFRRLRPGAEGLVLLVFNGIRWGARRDERALVKRRIPDLLRQDPEGVVAAARAIRAPQMLRAASAVQNDDWATATILSFEARAIARSLFSQPGFAKRILLRTRSHGRFCPVDQALRNGRRVPADLDRWFRSIEAQPPTHRLVRL